MRWTGRRESGNIEDRRGAGGLAVGGGIGAVVIALLAWFLGGDPRGLVGLAQNDRPPAEQEEKLKQFVGVVLADTEDVWNQLLHGRRGGAGYEEPKLVLFSGQVDSACGFASAAVGPFYCPPDSKVYIDLSFFEDMQTKLGAGGDFAMAYVVAHEIGHHVQNLLGQADKVHQARGRVSEREYNQLSVRLELQADFYAGVWAHHAQRTKQILEQGDLEEALNAAAAIGDDRLQKRSRGHVVPDSFTHGTSAQRARWFLKGYKTGDMSQGDTFSMAYGDL